MEKKGKGEIYENGVGKGSRVLKDGKNEEGMEKIFLEGVGRK